MKGEELQTSQISENDTSVSKLNEHTSDVVQEIHDNFLKLNEDEQRHFNVLTAFKKKMQLPDEELPEDLARHIIQIFDGMTMITREASLLDSSEIENDSKYDIMCGITRNLVLSYNDAVREKGKYKDHASEFLYFTHKNGLNTNITYDESLDSAFQSLYYYYKGKPIPESEINNIDTLKIGMPTSRSESIFSGVFGCCSRYGTSKSLKENFRKSLAALTQKSIEKDIIKENLDRTMPEGDQPFADHMSHIGCEDKMSTVSNDDICWANIFDNDAKEPSAEKLQI